MFVLSFLPSTDRCLFLIRSAVSWKEACLTTLRTYPSIAKRTCAVFLNKVRRTRLCLEIILTYGGLITNVWGILKKVVRQSETGISVCLLIRLNWKLYIKIQFLIKKSDMSIFGKILKLNDEEKVPRCLEIKLFLCGFWRYFNLRTHWFRIRYELYSFPVPIW